MLIIILITLLNQQFLVLLGYGHPWFCGLQSILVVWRGGHGLSVVFWVTNIPGLDWLQPWLSLLVILGCAGSRPSLSLIGHNCFWVGWEYQRLCWVTAIPGLDSLQPCLSWQGKLVVVLGHGHPWPWLVTTVSELAGSSRGFAGSWPSLALIGHSRGWVCWEY